MGVERGDSAPQLGRTGLKKKGLLKDQLEIVKVKSNGKIKYAIQPLEEQLSFDKGFYVFIRAVQYLASHNQGVVVVGLAGPSGSGKTIFSEKVQHFLPGCAILSMDNYNDGSRVIDSNFDDPRLTDYDTLLQNITDLKSGQPTQVPMYDFKLSKRVGYRTQKQPTSRVVIIEGIYSLSARLRPLEDLRVSITGGVHFDLVKRVLRDINRSGQAPEEIIQQISDTVYPMYKAYIEPDLKTAHLKIYNTFNPFSGFMDPTYILKSAQRVSKETIHSLLKAEHTERKESETYDIYLLPPNEDPETCQSWLRMRNRDGRYNLMFEEWVCDGPFIISPRITFEVSVRILGGLMALGYEIGTIMKRNSIIHSDDSLTIKLDTIEGMGAGFVQVQGKDRSAVAEAGRQLGLDGTYIARSYIEQVQLEQLTASFQNVTDDMRQRFVVDGQTVLDESIIGTSPIGSFRSGSLRNSLMKPSMGRSESSGGQDEVSSNNPARLAFTPPGRVPEEHKFSGFAVPSSEPVNVPSRKRSSTSEEHSAVNLSRAGSTERSLLSQQMRLSSGNNLSQIGNGSAHIGPGSVEDLEARVGSSRQNFISTHSIGRESPDGAVPLLDGGLHGVLNGITRQGSLEQPLALNHNHRRAPNLELGQQREGQLGQAHAPAPLCHEVLKQHTQMNEPHCSNAALVEQIQALTATHQQLAIQMQALVKVVGDQHTAATTHDSASSFVTAATFAMCVAFGAIIARSFM